MWAPDREKLEELSVLRVQLARGERATQGELDAIAETWTPFQGMLRPGEKEEVFSLVDAAGQPLPLRAPRWLCHLLGLRHGCAHVLLEWSSPAMGRVFVLQVRSWTRGDVTGHLDISVGGHVCEGISSRDAAYQEMEEELGLTRADLRGRDLVFCQGYESYDECREKYFYNAEWRDVYIGEITTAGLEKIRFADQEVVGLYFCPEPEARNLLTQEQLPIASGLELSLPHCLRARDRG